MNHLCQKLAANCQPCQSADASECYHIAYNLEPGYFAASSKPSAPGTSELPCISLGPGLLTLSGCGTLNTASGQGGNSGDESSGPGNLLNTEGQVPLGGSDLAQMAKDYRTLKSLSPSRNVVAFEYDTDNGPGYLFAANEPRIVRVLPGLPSEQVVDAYIKGSGIDPDSVMRIYSERIPCATAKQMCFQTLNDTYKNAEVSFSLNGLESDNWSDINYFMKRP